VFDLSTAITRKFETLLFAFPLQMKMCLDEIEFEIVRFSEHIRRWLSVIFFREMKSDQKRNL